MEIKRTSRIAAEFTTSLGARGSLVHTGINWEILLTNYPNHHVKLTESDIVELSQWISRYRYPEGREESRAIG